MMIRRALTISLTAVIALLSTQALSRALYDNPGQRAYDQMVSHKTTVEETPYVSVAAHRVGQLALTVTNQGTFGTGFASNATCGAEACPSAEFPINSNVDYLFAGAFWVGAVVGRDTLVSTGADGWSSVQEMWPASLEQQNANDERMTTRSISDPDDPEFELALSEQDVTCVYFDTLTEGVQTDGFENRPHVPLGMKIRQSSYAWSYGYAEDFVLFDYKITNIGRQTLEKVYFGIYVDGDVGHPDEQSLYTDDICGFKLDVDQLDFQRTSCEFTDTIRIAWIADNDGVNTAAPATPDKTGWDPQDPRGVTGSRVVRTPSDSLKFSFNWWISNGQASLDFGPRKQGTEKDPFRDFGGFLGTPEGDKNKYYIMSHEEFDYDQLFSAVDNTAQGWLPPDPTQSTTFADGFDTRYLLSFGPFTVFTGETLPLTFAYVAGSEFHVHPQDMNNFFTDARQPQAFYNSLNFKDFGVNAQWASWIYDNPGVDTDGDGFRGKFRLCCDSSLVCTAYDTIWVPNPNVPGDSMIDTVVAGDEYFCDCDTVYYEGDGAPDFRGASPPPAPVVRVTPRPGSLIVRWNGLRSETTPDDFSTVLDFEGYRVYLGLNRRISDLILQSSYDRKNFTRYAWNEDNDYWQIAGPPQTIEEIQYLYANGNTDYNPLVNGLDNPLPYGDSLLYFTQQDFNQDDLTDTAEIHKPEKYRYNYNPDGTVMLDEFGNPVPTPYPHTLILDSAFTSDTFLVDESTGDTTWYMGGELTEDGKYFKYFEYEFRLPNLLTSQLYYVSVTSFDFGAPETGLDALESNPLINAVAEFPQNPSDIIAQEDLGVVVYPNPYRVDGNYRAKGFEGREKDDFRDERVRQLNFTNLPPRCSIKIFTLDGDLVREIDHETIANEPQSMHDSWDLVTRNLQPAVSGIYYWTVEDKDSGEVQSGKLVLIM